MSRPSVNFIAKSFIPTSTFSFALKVVDFRLLIALNSSSISYSPYIPIYVPHRLNEQLDQILRFVYAYLWCCFAALSHHYHLNEIFPFRLTLERQLLIDDSSVASGRGMGGLVTVILPQVCQWYAKEFGVHDPVAGEEEQSAHMRRTPSSREILQCLLPYLTYEKIIIYLRLVFCQIIGMRGTLFL